MKTHTIYLALGSNLGDRYNHLHTALQQLQEVVEIALVSSVYETEPVGYLAQPHFLNLVCQGQTSLSPQELLQHVKAIETAMGRQTTFPNGPRPIDIDILLYDDIRVQQANLIIPHPRMHERAFVLLPLVEITPQLIEPSSGKTVTELLSAIAQKGVVKVAPVGLYEKNNLPPKLKSQSRDIAEIEPPCYNVHTNDDKHKASLP